MNQKDIQRVLEHVEADHKILISSCYVDSFATVYEREDGVVVYRSDVWAETPLADLAFHKLSFYAEMNP